MKKTFLKTLILGSVFMAGTVGAQVAQMAGQQFVDCSAGDGRCDVLYAAEDIFQGANAPGANGLVRTTDVPLATSEPVRGAGAYMKVGQNPGYQMVLPEGATQTSDPANPLPGTVVVPGGSKDSRVEILPDGSVRTTTVTVTRQANADGGYQETTQTLERTDTEELGAVWVEQSLADKVRFGDTKHDWEAPRGETLRALLMQWGEVSGWTVVWKLDKDYQLEAGVVFRGTFTEVASAIIRTFARAVPAPIGTFYKGNRVLVVSVQEDENAH